MTIGLGLEQSQSTSQDIKAEELHVHLRGLPSTHPLCVRHHPSKDLHMTMTSPQSSSGSEAEARPSTGGVVENSEAGEGDDGKKPSARENLRGNDVVVRVVDEGVEHAVSETSADANESSRIISSSSRTPQDILCGRGMPFQSYPGNIAMHDVVNLHKDEYIACRRSDKPRVIKKIIQTLKDSGARFIKPYGEFNSNENDRWVEVDDQYVYDKISHVMRHRQRAARSEPAGASTLPGNEVSIIAAPGVISTAVMLPERPSSGITSAGLETLRNLLPEGSVGSLASLAPAGQQSNNLNALLGQLFQSSQTSTPRIGATDQQSILHALIQSERAAVLSELGLAGATSLLGQNQSLGNQQLLRLLGAQQQQQQQQQQQLYLQEQQQQQTFLEQALVAHLQQQQMQREIQNQRLLAAAASLQVNLGQPQGNSATLNQLAVEELRRQLWQRLGQNQENSPQSNDHA
jgi:hypothetical protein